MTPLLYVCVCVCVFRYIYIYVCTCLCHMGKEEKEFQRARREENLDEDRGVFVTEVKQQ